MEASNLACFVVLFSCLLAKASSLSCYTCEGDYWNWGSCTINFKQCAPFQDACASYTTYGLPVHFYARPERYNSISKGCDTMSACLTRQAALDSSTCFRSSYSDWACVECCTGDLCNYYITLGAGVKNISLACILLAVLAQFFFLFL